MVDLKQLRAEVKQSLTKDNTADILSFIGYQVNRDYKFKLREDERTPSASIRNDGYIRDFGSDWGGDVVALLHEYHGQSLPDAVKYVADCLGVNYAD